MFQLKDSFGTALNPKMTGTVGIEPLEGRQLFAGIGFSHHQLTLNGSSNLPSSITVGLSADGQSVDAHISMTAPKRIVQIDRSIPLSKVIRLVVIRGGSDDDIITVDETNGLFPIKTRVIAGDGNDTVTTGNEPDYVVGGKGDDSISTGGGNDTLFGQAGDDTLIGGAGDDYLSGAKGHDLLMGEDGNDILVDARGPDKMYGGSGFNAFYLHSLKLDHANDFDKTKDKLHYITYTAPVDNTNPTLLQTLFPAFSFF